MKRFYRQGVYFKSLVMVIAGVPTAQPSAQPNITPLPGQPWSPVPSCQWTVWMNSDIRTPVSRGDYETIANLRLTYPFCEHPVAIQCRVSPTSANPNGTPFDVAKQVGVTCDLNHGLVCLDSEQPNGAKCFDYQVRFHCVDACTSSTPFPPSYTGETPSPYPLWYTGPTPTAHPFEHSDETPTPGFPPVYSGETPSPYPPWYTGPTPHSVGHSEPYTRTTPVISQETTVPVVVVTQMGKQYREA